MAFVRLQGKQMKIMHTRRVEGKVRQERLHIFPSTADAAETIGSEARWKLLCDSIEANFGISLSKSNRNGLRGKIEEALRNFPEEPRKGELPAAAEAFEQMLSGFNEPLTPQQAKQLREAKDALVSLMDTLSEKLTTLIHTKENEDILDMSELESPTEAIFESGLDHYREGRWDEAKALYHKGLSMDPEHVDLHVHAGLINLYEEHYDLALAHFNQAVEYGKPLVDKVKAEIDQDDSLYHDLEVRPFFRAVSNKAITLMRMKRWNDAIEVLQMGRSYQALDGTSNMIGDCYAAQGEYEEANKWFVEMHWPEAWYTKAFLLFKLDELEDSIHHLLRAVTQNWMIAELIAGKRKPEKGRYIYTSGIDLWLSASEYFHDSKHMYTRQNRFHALVRTILGDTRIAGTLEELKVAHNRRMDEQGYSMPKRLFSMIANGGDPGFSTEHSARIYSEYYNTENANWIPDQNEIICAIIEEKMQQNWRMKLAGTSEKQFYFRPGATTPGVAIGNQVMICVTKGWIHQKRLYVSGKI